MNWQFTRRTDGLIAVTLDNNVWDFLFEKKMNLATELPADEFAVFITREVEIESMVGKKEMNSQLSKNEADAVVGAQSFFSVALTCEKPEKSGPLRFAAEHGGQVHYLPDIYQSGLTLKASIADFHDA